MAFREPDRLLGGVVDPWDTEVGQEQPDMVGIAASRRARDCVRAVRRVQRGYGPGVGPIIKTC
jgi:hypothetical protein